jgi:hypothetical protein
MIDESFVQQLTAASHQLKTRSYELSQSGDDHDIAMIMAALAVTMDAVKSLGEDINQLVGPKGLGASGE